MSKRRAKDQPGGQVQRMGELQALLARVQAATGPDRELDADLCVALSQPCSYIDNLRTGRKEGVRCAALTSSLDAALALVERVLPNTSVAVKRWASGTGDAEIGGAGVADTARARAKTPALALLAATILALSHQQPHDQIREGEG